MNFQGITSIQVLFYIIQNIFLPCLIKTIFGQFLCQFESYKDFYCEAVLFKNTPRVMSKSKRRFWLKKQMKLLKDVFIG